MAYKNTGKALATKWDYISGGTTVTQKLLNTSGVELEPNAIQYLTDDEYIACFNYTINYMKNTLGWEIVPSLSESIKNDQTSCPIPNVKVIEPKFETYETGDREYRIFFASAQSIPTDIQIKVEKVNPSEQSIVNVTSSIVSPQGVSYVFTFTDGTVEKTIGDTIYLISPYSITLPRKSLGDMIFYTPLTGSYRDAELISDLPATSIGTVNFTIDGADFSDSCLRYELPIDLVNENYTFACWAKGNVAPSTWKGKRKGLICYPEQIPPETGNWNDKLSLRANDGNHPELGNPCGMGYTNGPATYGQPVTDTGWHHYVGMWNCTLRKFYIYLDKVNYAIGEQKVSAARRFEPFLYIGGEDLSVDNFIGLIKEVKIWNRLLTQSEINAL